VRPAAARPPGSFSFEKHREERNNGSDKILREKRRVVKEWRGGKRKSG
jgi:hypothetical protein